MAASRTAYSLLVLASLYSAGPPSNLVDYQMWATIQERVCNADIHGLA